MAEYTPPLRDIKFVLSNIVDLAGLASLEGFEHADPDTVFGALDEGGRFMAEVVAPTNTIGDKEGVALSEDGVVVTPEAFKAVYQSYVQAGWGAVPFPPEFGGHGFPWVVGLSIQEMLAASNMAFSLNPMLTQGAIEAVLLHGSEELQAIYLEKLITAEWSGTMCLTEPQAGSDLGVVRTKAIPQDDGTYRITGQKIFITWGDHDLADNVIHLVLARTPDGKPGTKGLSMFLVPKVLVNDDGSLGDTNEVSVVSLEHKLGIHASPTCVLAFGDDEGSIGYLVGEEFEGMKNMFTMMNSARLSVGLQGLAISERAYQDALQYAQERKQGRAVGTEPGTNSLIIEHPDVRRMLMTQRAYIEAMRSLIYTNAEAMDIALNHPDEEKRREATELADLLTPLSKAWSTDLGVELTSLAIQVFGGMGYVEEAGVAQHYRDARIAPIYEGTNGIQGMDLVGRKLPMRGGEVIREFIQRMAAIDTELADAGEELASIRSGMTEGISVLTDATMWLAQRGMENINDALAAATPYLRLFSTVTGGWFMARQALAAHAELNNGSAGDEYLQAKIVTARFYAEQLLPQAAGLLGAVKGGADVLFEIEPGMLGV
ncbi:MAG: acyl-CoA dehydrogenase [Acidimicrobiia bacterium]|nr:acyl-CoA dehydrogenase [Acidimicrobiia bacterium]